MLRFLEVSDIVGCPLTVFSLDNHNRHVWVVAGARVISLNLHGRHLSESQRAAVAAKLANMMEGGRAANSANLQSSTPISQAAAASMLNVSTRSVAYAAKVQQAGVPELAAALDAGTVSVSAAAAVCHAAR